MGLPRRLRRAARVAFASSVADATFVRPDFRMAPFKPRTSTRGMATNVVRWLHPPEHPPTVGLRVTVRWASEGGKWFAGAVVAISRRMAARSFASSTTLATLTRWHEAFGDVPWRFADAAAGRRGLHRDHGAVQRRAYRGWQRWTRAAFFSLQLAVARLSRLARACVRSSLFTAPALGGSYIVGATESDLCLHECCECAVLRDEKILWQGSPCNDRYRTR